jgi:hypothetical protein
VSVVQLWGTGGSPTVTRRRITSEGDIRVTSEGDVRIASAAPQNLIFLRKTSAGDQRVTSAGDRRITFDGVMGPQYFQTSPVTTDGGEVFGFRYETDPWQPGDPETGKVQGGEHEFREAFIALAWSMSGTIRVTPFTDGHQSPVTLADGSVLEIVPSTFVLPQQPGNLNRINGMFAIPVVRRKVMGGVEVARWYLRGERLQVLIESTEALGVGELMLEGIEVESAPVQKAEYETVATP